MCVPCVIDVRHKKRTLRNGDIIVGDSLEEIFQDEKISAGGGGRGQDSCLETFTQYVKHWQEYYLK